MIPWSTKCTTIASPCNADIYFSIIQRKLHMVVLQSQIVMLSHTGIFLLFFFPCCVRWGTGHYFRTCSKSCSLPEELYVFQVNTAIKNALGCMKPNIESGLRKSMALVSSGSLGKMCLLWNLNDVLPLGIAPAAFLSHNYICCVAICNEQCLGQAKTCLPYWHKQFDRKPWDYSCEWTQRGVAHSLTALALDFGEYLQSFTDHVCLTTEEHALSTQTHFSV